MSTVLKNLSPDVVVIVGDRFEMMSVTIAAAYMNIPIAHTMGGEVTGTIDESIRHAITKFAHIHFPANEDAKERIIKMGEAPDTVFNVGCPRLDLVKEELKNDSAPVLSALQESKLGVGTENLDLSQPFLLVSQHPVTTEYGSGRDQIFATLDALQNMNMQTIMLWPNIDAGSDDVSSGIRTFREKNNPNWLKVYKNLPTSTYIHLMKNTACLIGNSSSGIREGAFIGTPVVNIGTRQKARQRGENVIDVGYNATDIYNAIKQQLDHGRYTSLPTYGDGSAGAKIADILASISVTIQKQITY
jgi:UDP-hydrolysing UDP-N-acetyl-D-glucosamine 2-epimerase